MSNFITSWKWTASAMAAMLVFGLAVSANAQDTNAQEKSIEEMQMQILQLQGELDLINNRMRGEEARRRNAEAANDNVDAPAVAIPAARSRDDASGRPAARRQIPRVMTSDDRMKILAGNYLGMEGNDWFGIVIEEPKDGVSVITFYEDGLPEHGYKPNDDDKYVGTATIDREWFPLSNEFPLFITLNQKFDGQREEFVEPDLRKFTAQVTREDRNDGTMPPAIKIAIPRNREWDDVIVERAISELNNGMIPGESFRVLRRGDGGVSSPVTPWTPEAVALIGRYLGHEGDDRMGMVLSQSRGAKLGTYNVIFYDDGLPGAGHNRRDDDRYEGTAVLAGDNGDRLEISITRKFDGERQERVEQPLQKMTAQLVKDQAGNMMVRIPHNGEWDEVLLKKL